MAATSRLSLYNGALRNCGDRLLASLSENRESRRMLDAAWDDNFVKGVLEDGLWLFACRSGMYDYSPSVEPGFGYRRAFNKPTDFVNTMTICQDEYFREPLLQVSDEAGFWFSDLDTLYIKYVSNDPTFGGDMARWPQSFVDYVEVKLASKIVVPLKQNRQALLDLLEMGKELLVVAKSQNAMAEPTKFPPKGTWVRARTDGGRWNNGNRR